MRKLLDELDARTGFRAALRYLLDEPVKGGARFAYAFGSALLLLLALQALSGVLLATGYAPTTTAAWASIVHFEEKTRLGWFIRGFHAHGASAILIVLALHYAQVVWFGAYKKPREVNWALGLFLALAILGFSFTGYLLPWDQKGYWATKVGVGIAAATPIVGETSAQAIMGGSDLSSLTLTRFYALHVIVLPWTLFALVALHLWVFRRHGVTTRDAEANAPAVTFFPAQAFRDVVLGIGIVAVLAVFVWKSGGADLEGPADPSSAYVPRPERYFLPLFQLLKYFPGKLEPIGSVVVPGAVFTVLLLLPLFDRGASHEPRDRRGAIALAFAPLALGALLGLVATVADRSDERIAETRREAREDAELARRLARNGVPPEGAVALLDHDPTRLGVRTFRARCGSCHVAGDHGRSVRAPTLTGYLSIPWLKRVIKNPNDPTLFGARRDFKDAMGETEATPDELEHLAIYVRSLEGPEVAARFPKEKVARGKALYSEKSCVGCHDVRPGKASDGPNLAGYGSRAWLKEFLKDPGHPLFYGEANKMPKFGTKLSEEELDAVVGFLKGLEGP